MNLAIRLLHVQDCNLGVSVEWARQSAKENTPQKLYTPSMCL